MAGDKFHICTLAVLAVSDVDFSTLKLICNGFTLFSTEDRQNTTKKTILICSFSEDEELMGIMLEKEITFIPTVRELQDTALCQIGRMSRFWHISIIIIWLCRLYMIGKMAICAERILGQQGNGQEVRRMPGAKSMRLTAP